MSRFDFRRKVLYLNIAATALFTNGAIAQSGVTALGIEEVVVTAQKREEDMQSVPISISTLSENDIERRGVQNAADLVGTIPNMGGFQPPGARGNLSISLRGVSSGSPSNLSIDTAIAVYVDGFLLGKQIASGLDVAELERIEVLRGPQGTLYGRNSTGGAVNFITKKPTGEFGGKITGSVGSDSLWGLKTSMDTGTLGTDGEGAGTLKASFGAQTRQRDGLYGQGSPVNQDYDDTDRQAYRVALRWEPTDTVTFDYAYDKSKLDENNTVVSLTGLTPLALNPATGATTSRLTALDGYIQAGDYALNYGAGPLAAAASDPTFGRWLDSVKATRNDFTHLNQSGDRPSRGNSDAPSGTTADSEGHSLTVTWDFDELGALGAVEFKSMTGWRNTDSRNIGDLDGTDNTIAPGGSGALNDSALGAFYQLYAAQNQFPASFLSFPRATMEKLWGLVDQYGGGGFVQDANFGYEQFSQELQMVGSTERLEYAIGYYYFEDNGKFDNYRLAATPVGGTLSSAYDNETEANAFYVQGTWTPPILDDRLAITLGYRHTEETKGVTYRYLDDGASTGDGLFIPTASCAGLDQAYLCVNQNYTGDLVQTPEYGDKFDQQFSNDSGSATVAYQVTDTTNVFVRWSNGYRSGGYNGEIYNNPFEEETIEQWELGVKSDILPGTLRVNASIFSYIYDDLQVSQISVNPAGQPTSYITNAGKAERWGSELEVQWSPLDNLLVAASWSHMDGDYDEYPALCGTGAYADVCINTNDLALRGVSPDDSLSLITDWVFASTDWADFMAHVEVFWQDKTTGAALWTNNYAVPGGTYPVVYDNPMFKDRAIVNARIGIENVELSSGTLRASIWGRNLTDEEYQNFAINFGSLGPITEQFGEPLTYGLDVTYEF
ncbi:MAG: TonB-dependent receptor [Pseudomonadales bacterium]|nr:TonB-dependent receptor [Pseudomonadales bacterium]